MRVGSRWPLGGTPPAALPASLFPLVADCEAQVAHKERLFWTLTWLESRPRAALPGVGVVTLTPAGQPTVEYETAAQQESSHAAAPLLGSDIPDEDDDDWLL